MKIKLLPTIIAAAGFLSAPFALAANYQTELSAGYADIDANDNDENDYFIGLEGKYYFAPVDTANHPLAEAAFIEKSSSVYVSLDNTEWKSDAGRLDVYQRSIGVDLYVPNSMFYFGGGIKESKYKSFYTDSFGAVEGRSSQWDSEWFVKAGIAPIEGLLVWSEFVEDADISERWNINGKYVIALAGEQALNLEAGYENSELIYPAETLSVAADYYLDRHLSVGAGFVRSVFNEDEFNKGESSTDYFIRARNYFTDNIGVELGYIDNEYESSLTLGASVRF